MDDLGLSVDDSTYEIPVPGRPTDVVTRPRLFALTLAPGTPALTPIDFAEMFSRTPGATLMDLLIRKPMRILSPFGPTLARFANAGNDGQASLEAGLALVAATDDPRRGLITPPPAPYPAPRRSMQDSASVLAGKELLV